jgi:hypothetical protein
MATRLHVCKSAGRRVLVRARWRRESARARRARPPCTHSPLRPTQEVPRRARSAVSARARYVLGSQMSLSRLQALASHIAPTAPTAPTTAAHVAAAGVTIDLSGKIAVSVRSVRLLRPQNHESAVLCRLGFATTRCRVRRQFFTSLSLVVVLADQGSF